MFPTQLLFDPGTGSSSSPSLTGQQLRVTIWIWKHFFEAASSVAGTTELLSLELCN